MSSVSVSGELTKDSLKHFQSIYDRHRFTELYSLTSKFWNHSTDVDSLPVEFLILGGRLAVRLGGHRLYRWLLRKAIQRDHSNPRVRLFSLHINALRISPVEELKSFTAHPDIGGDDVEVRSSWYASFAALWARLRDFDCAYHFIHIAHQLLPGSSWIFSVESDIYGMEGRWNDALRSAECALEIDPGAPFACHSLGTALINLGHVDKSAARLFAESESCQSYELVMDACWHQCALAETLDGEQRGPVLDRARRLARRLPDLMPLADRESLKAVARANLDIAELSDDHAGIGRWATEIRSPFHRQVLANLSRNIQGKRIRLPFRRTIQKHAACLPTSVEAAMSAGGMLISADDMASEITFGGTPEWAAADWLRARGYHVRFFLVTPEVASKLIHNGLAFVIMWASEDGGHAVAVVGLDERAETVLVHDPQSFRSTQYLLAIFNELASPIGIMGMAVVKQEHAILLNALLPSESAIAEAAVEYYKESMLHGPSASRKVIADPLRQYPDHPGSIYLEATQALEDGKIGQALGKWRELLQQFPHSPPVRVGFFSASHALGNTALLRKALKEIVEEGMLPGFEEQQAWIYPPDRYIYEYADLLRLSTQSRARAESLLSKLIRRQWTSAGAWHTLADLLWQKRDVQGALLSYRISSCLAESNEHFARQYADALVTQKHDEEAFQWLESRARRFRNTAHAAGTWVSWISALEAFGFPERALAACNEALEQQGAPVDLLSFAVPFFARMGDWMRAEVELERLRNAGSPHALFEVSTRLHQMRGDLASAAKSAAAWISERPRSMEARYSMLEIIHAREGGEEAIRTSVQWMRENRNHEDFEVAYCAALDRAQASKWRKYSVLLRRLKRNPEDAWAWRELTFECLGRYEIANERVRKRLQPRITRFLTECDRTSGEAVQTLRAHALWSEARGDWAAAVAASLESIALDPEMIFSYRRAWECSSRLKAEEREELWNHIEPTLVNSSVRLSIAPEVMRLLADRFGIAAAEKSIESWRIEHPDDPDVVQAAADLLIDHGHGRSDAARAISMLEPAVQRFPYHSGLRFSLANAYRRAGREPDAEPMLVEIVRRHPNDSAAKIHLAWIMHRRKDEQGAYKILEDAMAAEPRSPMLLDSHVQILVENARYDEAIQRIEDGLRRLPSDVYWRERAIALLIRSGAEAKAAQTAREGIEIYPRGAYLWFLLGRTLTEMPKYAEVGEVESCLRRSLQLNCALFEAADLLAELLARQRQYDDASKVMLDIEPRMTDPSPARGRLAWIRRKSGQKSEAVADMAGVLDAAPWYGWGWRVLMEWLEEDSSWDLARKLLQSIPPPMFTNISFRRKRLVLLEEAKADAEQLDHEWQDLLCDFPENVALHMERYDSLNEALRWEEAASVIDAIGKVVPDDPFVLARRCEALSRDNKKDAALDIAMYLCYLPVEEYAWPSDKVWDVARSMGFAGDLSRRFTERLLAGNKPTLHSFSRMAAHVMAREIKGIAPSHISIWFPRGGVRELVRLVNIVSKAQWDGSEYRALAYSLLIDYGYQQLVPKLHVKLGQAAVTSVQEWAQIGCAFVTCHRNAQARSFLRAWRKRTGVTMWMVTNYILSLPRLRRDQLQERFYSTRDALAGLQHDHCAKYLVHIQAEACALLGYIANLPEIFASYARYFDGTLEKDEYFSDRDYHLLAKMPRLASYLYNQQEWRMRFLIWNLQLRRIWSVICHFFQYVKHI